MYMYRNGPKKSVATKVEEPDEDDGEDDDLVNSDASNQKITRENNHVYFHSEVNRGAIFQLLNHIRSAEEACILMKHRFNLKDVPIYLHISSFGGSVFDALTAIDVIQNCSIPIHTIIEGSHCVGRNINECSWEEAIHSTQCIHVDSPTFFWILGKNGGVGG